MASSKEYLQLLFEGKMCEAKAVRFSVCNDIRGLCL